MCHFLIKRAYRLMMLLAIAFMLYGTTAAQDIDRRKVDITYVVLPVEHLPVEVQTYAVEVKPRQTSWGNTLGNIYDAEKISLNGYHRLAAKNDADLIIETEVINEVVFDQAYAKSAELTYKKDKNSPEIKYVAYYYSIIYYTPKIAYRAYTKNGTSVFKGMAGGEKQSMQYGSTDYDNYYRNETSLSYAWNYAKQGQMANVEKAFFETVMRTVASRVYVSGMYKTSVSFTAKYVDEKKGKTLYEDLREALGYFEEAIALISTDKIDKINKLIQPDYEKRKELMSKAIAIWEKALSEANYDDKKARIDAKVARHLYYNLALAYLWTDDFAKAREYAQGRKKDVGSWDKNFLSGIRTLSALIDDRSIRQEANSWRKLMLTDDVAYEYKTPEQREQIKKEIAAKELQAKADSIAAVKASLAAKKTPVKKTAKSLPGKKPAAAATKSTLIKSAKS